MEKEKLEKIRGSFEKNGFNFHYFEDRYQALEKILSMMLPEKSVAFGGSMTLKELDMSNKLKGIGIKVVNHWEKEYENPYVEAMKCDYYFSSANAITEDGQIMNIDGKGNRVAGITFGHEKVFIIVGTNKIEKDSHSGWKRAREVAAPLNAQRFDIKTPCKATGKCSDCNSPDRICNVFSKLAKAPSGAEYYLFLIDEKLGY